MGASPSNQLPSNINLNQSETGFSLDQEHARLQQEVDKIQQLETKIKTELDSLTSRY